MVISHRALRFTLHLGHEKHTALNAGLTIGTALFPLATCWVTATEEPQHSSTMAERNNSVDSLLLKTRKLEPKS